MPLDEQDADWGLAVLVACMVRTPVWFLLNEAGKSVGVVPRQRHAPIREVVLDRDETLRFVHEGRVHPWLSLHGSVEG